MATIDMNNVSSDRVSLLIINLQVDLCRRSGNVKINDRRCVCLMEGWRTKKKRSGRGQSVAGKHEA